MGIRPRREWFEYSDRCREAGEIPYQLTQFKKYYRDYVVKNKATMPSLPSCGTARRSTVCTADGIGPNTAIVTETILTGYKVEQQGYRACMALLKLSDQYSAERLEDACAKALFYTPRPSYKSIQTILKSGQDSLAKERNDSLCSNSSEFGFTRGADYYGRRDK